MEMVKPSTTSQEDASSLLRLKQNEVFHVFLSAKSEPRASPFAAYLIVLSQY